MTLGFQGAIAFFSSSLQVNSEGKKRPMLPSLLILILRSKKPRFSATGSSLNPIQHGSGNHFVPGPSDWGRFPRHGEMKEEPMLCKPSVER